jgi:hypothetical protein
VSLYKDEVRVRRSVLNWESKVKSSCSFLAFLLGVWFFQPWMFTFALLIPFLQETKNSFFS